MTTSKIKLDWIDALKAFALLGILLNHAVESYGIMPWFSNPSEYWPSFDERMANIFPKEGSLFVRIIQFLGWLGDMGPGVFILLSGLTLTLSALNKPVEKIDFYKARAVRIYPLYITIHLITLIFVIFYFKWQVGFAWSFLSLLGLRFLNSLFWFINPSWWFIWLILQLYLIFPFLINLIKKRGPVVFLVITLLITLLSRISGILGYTLTADMEIWMTGVFAGTRLFEFSFGMFIGYLIQNKNEILQKILKDKVKLPVISVLTYILGFAASLTYVGSIFSLILITTGISGIFYSIYEFIIKGNVKTEQLLIWLGKNSFSTFLIHQSFMKYYGETLTGITKATVIIAIILLSIIAGNYIEKMVDYLFKYLQEYYFRVIAFFKNNVKSASGFVFVAITVILSFLYSLAVFQSARILLLVFLFQFLYFLFYRILVNPTLSKGIFRYFDLTVFITFVVLFFRGNWFAIYGLLIILSYILLFITHRTGHWKAVILVSVLLSLSVISFESYLRNYRPLEMHSWGELPALQSDNETVYALIPNKQTHLKYNNYDYILQTNSFGFASPEVSLGEKARDEVRILVTGDAFSMPEGMEYEYSYPAILEKKLKNEFQNKTIKIINAGVTGYGPNEVLAQMKKFIGKIKPDIVINEMFINEFQEINLTENERLEEIGLVKKDFANKRIREKIQMLGSIQLVNQVPFLLKNLAGLNEMYNYDKSLLFFYEVNSPLYNDSIILKMNSYLVDIKELCLRNNAALFVMGVPGQVEISNPKYISYFPKSVNLNDPKIFDLKKPLHIIENLCQKNDINYLSSKNILLNYPEQPLYFEESWHWNKKGHNVIAGFLFESLKHEINSDNIENK